MSTADASPVVPAAGAEADPVERGDGPADGVALCLSGGGYRAMLFHAGALWRLNEAGWLRRLDRVSSVSGGSITAGVLGRAWPELGFDDDGVATDLVRLVVEPVRALASTTIDVGAVLTGLVAPRRTVSERVTRAYRRALFDGATLQDLPDHPRFVFNASSLQSGALWRFSKPFMGDHRVGRIARPTVGLAEVVAASSAFPPLLSPFRLDVGDRPWITDAGNDLARPDMRERVVLSDGGVYDNLGLETAWKRCRTVLVSDGGGQMEPQARVPADWGRQLLRVLSVVDDQVRDLRKRQCVGAFAARRREGAYWGIRTDIDGYGVADALPCRREHTRRLALEPTRLRRLDDRTQDRLINWGYAICDAALRAHVDPAAAPPAGFPYPGAGT